jgi:hypothetical protein
MKALVLGGSLTLAKITAVLYRTDRVKDELTGHFVEFVQFILLSSEIPASVAVPLTTITDRIIGMSTGRPELPLQVFRASLAAVVESLAARLK